MDQSLVNVHKQLQSLCAAPKEILCVRYLGAGLFLAPLLPLPARKSESVPKAFVLINETDFT